MKPLAAGSLSSFKRKTIRPMGSYGRDTVYPKFLVWGKSEIPVAYHLSP